MRLKVTLLMLTVFAAAAGPVVPRPGTPRTEGEKRPAAAGMAAAPAPTAASRLAIASLQGDLERLIGSPGWRGDRWSVMVVSLDQGDTLFNHGGDELLAPASNLKLYTTAAALYYLGPQFRYNTFLLATGPIENGVLRGDVVLYGTGDPTISSRFGTQMSVWRAFADTLKAMGIREITGNVVGDGSYFAGSGSGAGWKEDYINAYYAAPAGALSYAENIANVEIRPAKQAGAPPDVRLVPGGHGMEIDNQARTVASGRSWINVSRAGYDGPITVRGQVRRGSGALQRSLPVADPAGYAAAVLHEVVEAAGIKVTGGVRSVRAPSESPLAGRSVFAPAYDRGDPLRVLALHNSPPLLEILDIVNHKSHNLMAEQALRTVGRVAQGEGSAEAGANAVLHLLDEATPGPLPDVSINDGSGLSPLNRVSARSTVHVLSFMAKSPMWDAFWQTLPEAGEAGGLRRMYRTRAQGNLRAKTGTIEHVSSLSGYVRAANGERLAFSIISNNVPSTWKAKRIEDAIGARLANFTRDGSFDVPNPDSVTVAGTETSKSKPKATSSRSSGRTYRIRPGDTLSEIAQRNHTTVKTLQRLNPGLSAKRLMPGKKIRLP